MSTTVASIRRAVATGKMSASHAALLLAYLQGK